MKDKESIFKNAIEEYLDSQLNEIGYKKTEEWKGYIKYESINNYLKFYFEWNRGEGFGCDLGFYYDNPFNNEYSLGSIIYNLNANKKLYESKFGREFSEQIQEWIQEVSNQISQYEIQKLESTNSIIKKLRSEFKHEVEEYNKDLQLRQLKRNADKAWSSKDYKLFITMLENNLVGLPSSYAKKISIAKKKTHNEK